MGVEHAASRTIERLQDAVARAGTSPVQQERARRDELVVACLHRAGYRVIEPTPGWEDELLAGLDEDQQVCWCGEIVHYLSSRGLCDGCEEEADNDLPEGCDRCRGGWCAECARREAEKET